MRALPMLVATMAMMAVAQTSPVPRRVAVVGGGVSGLSCAWHLQRQGVQCVVFDTGKRMAGGRCSSRTALVDGEEVVMDHSAQFFTASDARFLEYCRQREGEGHLAQWAGPIAHIDRDLVPRILPSLPTRYVGRKGMRSLALALGAGVDVRVNTWVSGMERDGADGTWTLRSHGKSLGRFDAVVVAHNGKCADRLMSTSGAARIHALLKVSFGPSLPANARRMQLCSLFAMVVVLKEPLPALGFDAAYVKDSTISWVCNTSAKTGATTRQQSWTVVSTREFAASNKVPQEAIPKEKEAEIKTALLGAFARVLGLQEEAMQIGLCRIQLWGAAVPLNRLAAPFAWDGRAGVGVCGDWFRSAPSSGPGIESAFCSGRALAEHMAGALVAGAPLDRLGDVGLEGARFEACDGHPLGDVPGLALAAAPLTRQQSRGTSH